MQLRNEIWMHKESHELFVVRPYYHPVDLKEAGTKALVMGKEVDLYYASVIQTAWIFENELTKVYIVTDISVDDFFVVGEF